MTALLTRLVRGRRRAATPPVPVTVYSREACCCCDKALAVLAKYERAHNLAIEVVDVDSDPDLVAAYGLTVPVVAIDGKVRFKGVVNPILLERLLAARRRA